jgi:glycosyltransferase involved in cell wall biosynthesis
MKVLQIGASWLAYQFSGLERYYAELVTRLPSLGTEVTGLVYELKDSPEIKGLNLISFGTQDKNVVLQYWDQRRLVKTYLSDDIDIIVSHCTPSLFPALDYLGHKPLICHFHGPRYLERAVEGANPLSVRLSKYIEQKVYARTDHAITLSHYMKRVLVETYGFAEKNISVVPGGVNVDHFRQTISRQEARQQLGLPSDRPLIVTVRRLERRMGLHSLIEAIHEVARKYPDILLLIAGKGALREELDKQIRTSHLNDHIRALGAVSEQDLPLLYRAADFSIVPSSAYEGFGLILLESLASGTPVLGTPVAAIPEVLGPLDDALLLEGATPAHLAAGIIEALSGRRKLPSMTECERYAVDRYAWPLVVSNIHSVYRDVLGAVRNGANRLDDSSMDSVRRASGGSNPRSSVSRILSSRKCDEV